MTTNISSPSKLTSGQTWAILASMLIIDSMHLIFGRMMAPLMSPFVSSFYVLFVATIQVFIYVALRRKFQWQVFRENTWFFIAIGFFVAVATVLNYTAVSLIDAGTVALVGRISTVVTLLLSYFWLREKLSRHEVIGAALCILGALVISFQPGDVFQLGSLIVLIGVSCYSVHIAIVKKYGDNLEFTNFFLYRIAMTTFFLAIFMTASGNLAAPPSGQAWLIILVTGTVDVVISRILYYWALRQMRLSIHTIALTLTPVLTILWSTLFFAERPTGQGLIGGGVILAGIVIVAIAQQQRQRAKVGYAVKK